MVASSSPAPTSPVAAPTASGGSAGSQLRAAGRHVRWWHRGSVVRPARPQRLRTQFTQAFQLYSVAVQSTGKIVLGGSPNMALRRLDVDGSIDSSFAAGFSNSASPTCFSDHEPGGGYARDLIIDSTDRIIVAGSRARSVGSAVTGCPRAASPKGRPSSDSRLTAIPGPSWRRRGAPEPASTTPRALPC